MYTYQYGVYNDYNYISYIRYAKLFRNNDELKCIQYIQAIRNNDIKMILCTCINTNILL